MDQIWLLECTSDDNHASEGLSCISHASEDQEHVTKTTPTFPFVAPALWRREQIFAPNPMIYQKWAKNNAEHSNNTQTTLSTNEQRTTFRLAMNTHLTFSLGTNVRML